MPVIAEPWRLRQEGKQFKARIEEIVQWLRPLHLTEDPSLITEYTWWLTTMPNSSSTEFSPSSDLPRAPGMNMLHRYKCKQDIYKNKYFLKESKANLERQ